LTSSFFFYLFRFYYKQHAQL